MKGYKMGGKMDTKGAMGNPKTSPLSPDEEADLQALKTLQQPDYDVGGPKRRYARGKVKRYARGGGMPDLTGDGKVTRADVLKGRGVFKKGGSVGSASKRADGCAIRGKTRGKMV